jgi:hypothetical protein
VIGLTTAGVAVAGEEGVLEGVPIVGDGVLAGVKVGVIDGGIGEGDDGIGKGVETSVGVTRGGRVAVAGLVFGVTCGIVGDGDDDGFSVGATVGVGDGRLHETAIAPTTVAITTVRRSPPVLFFIHGFLPYGSRSTLRYETLSSAVHSHLARLRPWRY